MGGLAVPRTSADRLQIYAAFKFTPIAHKQTRVRTPPHIRRPALPKIGSVPGRRYAFQKFERLLNLVGPVA